MVTTVSGGGVAAQADAVKMGIARALIEFNPELRKTLKGEGLLTRDARVKERKKYGQKGARKRFQFRSANALARCSVLASRLPSWQYLGADDCRLRADPRQFNRPAHQRVQSGPDARLARMQSTKEANWPRSP